MLLQKQADYNIKNKNNQLPLDLCERNEYFFQKLKEKIDHDSRVSLLFLFIKFSFHENNNLYVKIKRDGKRKITSESRQNR